MIGVRPSPVFFIFGKGRIPRWTQQNPASHMREASLNAVQQSLLQRFDAVGGVVEYVVLECEPASGEDATSLATHRNAAVTGLEVIRKRKEDFAAKTSKELNISVEQFFRLEIDYPRTNAMEGRKITDQEFLGTHYDHQQKRLVRGNHSMEGGYAFAFSDTPHGLYDRETRRGITADEEDQLFAAINLEVLGGITPASLIYEWPTDWSNYFDDGKEWWGSYLWTITNPGTNQIVVLAASTTD